MAINAVGVIFSNIHEENVPELVRRRTISSIPFGGRYRVIDFHLSNMVNAGITTVGLMANNNYRSLIDHLGSGKDWDLARKDGGLVLLPPYSDKHDRLYSTRMEALTSLTGFLKHRNEPYVVIADGDNVARMDISDIVAAHEKNKADITLVTHYDCVERTADFMTVSADEKGRVTDVQYKPHVKKGEKANYYAGVMVIGRKFLQNIVEDSVTHGIESFETEVIVKQVASLKIYNYDFKGYFAGMTSLAAYFKHNMRLLDKEVRDELFANRDIYTKVRDSAPSKYGAQAVVKNSLISDGCVIEGTVENSILFRGVKVAKGAVVKNSIVMQDTVINANASLNCVITDKNVVISDKRQFSACEEMPFYIQKGFML